MQCQVQTCPQTPHQGLSPPCCSPQASYMQIQNGMQHSQPPHLAHLVFEMSSQALLLSYPERHSFIPPSLPNFQAPHLPSLFPFSLASALHLPSLTSFPLAYSLPFLDGPKSNPPRWVTRLASEMGVSLLPANATRVHNSFLWPLSSVGWLCMGPQIQLVIGLSSPQIPVFPIPLEFLLLFATLLPPLLLPATSFPHHPAMRAIPCVGEHAGAPASLGQVAGAFVGPGLSHVLTTLHLSFCPLRVPSVLGWSLPASETLLLCYLAYLKGFSLWIRTMRIHAVAISFHSKALRYSDPCGYFLVL